MIDLPNIRDGLLIFSGFFAVFCLAVVVFTAWSSRVQAETYNFSYGQYGSILGLFIFGLIFTFGYSLPVPAQQIVSGTQRPTMFLDFFEQCMKDRDNTPSNRSECTVLSRTQTDIALGVTQMAVKVVTRTVDKNIDATKRQRLYREFYDSCLYKLPGSAEDRTTTELDYCNRFADLQTDVASGVKHVPEVKQTTVVRYKPTPYMDVFNACVGKWLTDKAPDPVAARNERIQMCHAQAKEVVAAKM